MTKEKRRALRLAQVRRQKIALCLLFAGVLLLSAALWAVLRNPGEKALGINASCEAYRPQVEAEAARYDMADYVDLLLALMMQESSGQGPDVMQASEGAYNTKYPQEPGGITDVSYSIQCGIQELKYAMDKAGVTGPDDIERIKLALQAYNFGADVYFSYMESRGYSSWSAETAEAFAQMASQGRERKEDDPLRDPAGPWDYGDQRYPEHVLRYYPPGYRSGLSEP